MLQTTLHLTRSSRLWTLQLLRFEVFQVRLQKKANSTVSIEIHKGAIFDCLKINHFYVIYILILFVLLAKLSCYLYVNIRMRNMFHFVQTFNARSDEHWKTLETNLPILINQGLNGCNLVCHLDSEPKC
jgi:hypothetical protein